jgi:hypothetical protein
MGGDDGWGCHLQGVVFHPFRHFYDVAGVVTAVVDLANRIFILMRSVTFPGCYSKF